jgi:hypothetical protein
MFSVISTTSFITERNIFLRRKSCGFIALHHLLSLKLASSSLDPIWTIKTGSLFLLKVTAKDLFQGDGMDFDVMDFDTIGSDERLGHAHIDPSTLFHCDGKRIQLQLDGNDATGSLAVRVRRATKSDEMFMENKVIKSSNRDLAFEESMRIIHAESKKKYTIETMMNGNLKVERFGMGPPVKKVNFVVYNHLKFFIKFSRPKFKVPHSPRT